MPKTETASTSSHRNKLIVKSDPEVKLISSVKLETNETFDYCDKTLEPNLISKQNLNTNHDIKEENQKIKEEPSFQFSQPEKDQGNPLSIDSCEIKYTDIKQDLEKDYFTEDKKESITDIKKELDNSNCEMRAVEHKTEFVGDDDYQIERSHDNEKNTNSDINEESVSGMKFEYNVQKKEQVSRKNIQEMFQNNLQIGISKTLYTVEKFCDAFKCNGCGIVFSSIKKLITHLRKVHKIHKIFECTICNNRFIRSSSLKTHITAEHMGLKNHKCNVCFKAFSLAGNAKQHFNSIHGVIKRFSCNDCYKSYKQITLLRRHIQRDHMMTDCDRKKYECSVCQKTYTEKRKLEVHILRIHTGIADYHCDICQKQCFGKDNMKKHIARIHNKNKFYYECNVCHEIFHKKLFLEVHIFRIHEKTESGFQCSECGKIFSTKVILRHHIFGIHWKKFKCSECFKCFSNKGHVKRHYDSVHRGIRIIRKH